MRLFLFASLHETLPVNDDCNLGHPLQTTNHKLQTTNYQDLVSDAILIIPDAAINPRLIFFFSTFALTQKWSKKSRAIRCGIVFNADHSLCRIARLHHFLHSKIQVQSLCCVLFANTAGAVFRMGFYNQSYSTASGIRRWTIL